VQISGSKRSYKTGPEVFCGYALCSCHLCYDTLESCLFLVV
jgi:hypothetical protein